MLNPKFFSLFPRDHQTASSEQHSEGNEEKWGGIFLLKKKKKTIPASKLIPFVI